MSLDMSTPRSVIYCRISRDPHGNELGVQRQEKECRQLAERDDLDVVDVFVDDDRSAYSGKPRPAFEAMKGRLQGGGVDVLIAWHPDRLTRQPRELEDLIDLLDTTNTTVRTVQTGQYDLSTPAGRMSARIVGAVARGESEHKSARLRAKHRQLAEAGALSGGGTRPFGYEDDRIAVRESEATVIRELADRLCTGESLRSLCADLRARGIAGPTGKPWTPPKLRTMLSSARIAGIREHRGATTTAVWPAIITADQHLRLRAVFADPTRNKHPGGRERKLLTGLLVCGKCGARMSSRPRPDGVRTYICAPPPAGDGCNGCKILAEPLEELVVATVLDQLDTRAATEALRPVGDDAVILEELLAVAGRRDELAVMWASGEVSRSAHQAAARALDQREEALRAQLAELSTTATVSADVEGVADRWPNLSHERRRAVLAAVIESIVVGPAVRGRNKFDPSRILPPLGAINWRV